MFSIIPLITTAIICFVVTPIVIKIAKKYNLVDDPKVRYHPAHTHQNIVPRAGGLAIFIAVSISLLLYSGISTFIVGLIASSLILTVVGLIDDRKDVNPYIRLITNSIAALIIIFCSQVRVPFITNPITGGIIHLDSWQIVLFPGVIINVWADIFAFLWIMWTMNIIGWSAGVDGQMPGFVAIAATVLGILSLRYTAFDPNQIVITVVACIVAGAFLGFLPWNFYPQKIMPGYGGKTLAGFFLGVLAILAYAKVGTALLVLGVPMLDAAFTLLRRLTSKKSLTSADKGHLHHRLLEAGWSKRQIALFYWVVSAILGIVALLVTSKEKLFTLLLTAVGFGGLLLWLNFFSQFSKQSDQDNG